MRKVALISGVLGQNGIYLSQHLIARGYTVYGICRKATLDASEHATINALSSVRFILRDAGDPALLSLLPEHPIDEVYHFAEYASPTTLDRAPHLLRSNARNASNMLALLRRHPEARLFWLGSTLQIKNRSTPYARSKNVTYARFKRAARLDGLRISCCFSANFYSQYAHPQSLASTIVHRLVRFTRCAADRPRFTNLHRLRTWGHARDFVEAYPLVLQDGQQGREYSIVSRNTLTIGGFIQRVALHLGVDASPLLRTSARWYSAYPSSVATEHLVPVQTLGWSERSGIDELIESLLRRHR